MFVFFSHDEDNGFKEGQVIALGGKDWYIVQVRHTASGVWLELSGVFE